MLERMFFQRIFTPELALNAYLIGDSTKKVCAIIDPPRLITPCLVLVQSLGFTVTDIIETHVHADFVLGSLELKTSLNNKPIIHSSGMGGSKQIPTYVDDIIQQDDIIRIGSTKLQAIHTPGHSPEHLMWICYDENRSTHVPWLACTGDLLFVGGVGRPDLFGSELFNNLAEQLYHSLFKKLEPFPDFMEIYPCHGAGSLCGKFYEGRWSSTLGYERLFNPYLIKKHEKDWIEFIRTEFTNFPNQFRHIKSLNLQGPPLMETLTTMVAEGSFEQLELEAFFIIDIRMPQKFAERHIKGSINIPFHDSFSQWCTWLVPPGIPLGLVVEDHYRDGHIANLLRQVGYDQPIVIFAFTNNHKSSFQMESLQILTPTEAKNNQTAGLYIIDVRSPSEWKEGHIPGAWHMELTKLEDSIKQLPLDYPMATICRSGMRSSIAASILIKRGFNISNIQGGMEAWISAGLPIEQ